MAGQRVLRSQGQGAAAGKRRAAESYLNQAARQIGTAATNDFLFGALHTEMSRRLFDGLTAIPPAPGADVLTGNRGSLGSAFDLEAPLAVESFPSDGEEIQGGWGNRAD